MIEARQRNRRVYREKINFDLSGKGFTERFRLSPAQVEEILKDLGPHLQAKNNSVLNITPHEKVLLTLRYYASGDFCYSVGDSHGISKAVVHGSINQVTELLNSLYFTEVVSWPEDRNSIATDFFQKFGFPCVCGAIDGTHVDILTPSVDEWQFVNRKGDHTINVMAVAGPDYRFYAVNSNWPGSVHDSRVLKESIMFDRFSSGWRPFPEAVLLGDAAYPLLEWLMTAFTDATLTTEMVQFNYALRKTRFIVENAFGILKNRFQCLKYIRVRKPEKASKIINACVILHNLIVNLNNPTIHEILEESLSNAIEETASDDGSDPPAADSNAETNQNSNHLPLPSNLNRISRERRLGIQRRNRILMTFRES